MGRALAIHPPPRNDIAVWLPAGNMVARAVSVSDTEIGTEAGMTSIRHG
jgi:hypothetical protein